MTSKSFDQLTVNDATEVVANNKFEFADTNDRFFDSDHWQEGNGFVDETPPPSYVATRTIERGLQRVFVAENLIRQVVKRRIDGVLSSSPKITVTRGGGDNEERDKEIQLAFASWIRKKKINERLRKLVRLASLHDKAYLRIIIPEGRQALMDSVESAIEALDFIFVDVLTREQAAIYTDPQTLGECSLYVYDIDRSTLNDPVVKKNGGILTERYAEISYVDLATGETVLEVISGDLAPATRESKRFNMKGNIFMFEVCDLLLITETVARQQRAINTVRTHMMINNKSTDWQRRIFFNAQPPGSLILDKESGKKIVSDDSILSTLPGTDLYLEGITEETADGERIKDPSMTVIDPGSVERFRQSEAQSREGLLRECHQLHTELGGSATSTGEARTMAMEDFQKDLGDVKAQIDDAGQWLIETAWMLANWIANSDASDVAFRFESLITISHIDNDRKRAALEEMRSMVISRSTASAERGVEDPESEMLLIESDPYQQMLLFKEVAAGVKQLVDAGASLRGALEAFKVPEELIKKLEEIDQPVDQPKGLPSDLNDNPPAP